MSTNHSPSDPTPGYEPGGNRLLFIIALIVATALGGMTWSFLSRQNAPSDAPPVNSRHLPPSQKPDTPAAAAARTAGNVPEVPAIPAQR